MKQTWVPGLAWGLLALVLALAALAGMGVRAEQLAELRGLSNYLEEYRHLDWRAAPTYLTLLWETLVMGIWGTILAIVIAVPLSGLASRAGTPHPWISTLVREYANFVRAIPDPILALIFVTAFGLGPVPGILALGLHSSGFLTKVLCDCMDRLPVSITEGLVSCGASRFQVVRLGLWPSIEREFLSYGFYLLDRNTRVAATLGFVGAGGIGLALRTAISQFEEARAGAIILLLVGLMVLIEALSTHFREKLSRS